MIRLRLPAPKEQMWEALQILALSQCLSELDARGEMPKYKALLAAMGCNEIGQAITLAGTLDEYIFDPETSGLEDVAIGEIGVMVGSEYAAGFAQYVTLTAFGRSLLERDHAVITGYGLIARQDCQPVQSVCNRKL